MDEGSNFDIDNLFPWSYLDPVTRLALPHGKFMASYMRGSTAVLGVSTVYRAGVIQSLNATGNFTGNFSTHSMAAAATVPVASGLRVNDNVQVLHF